MSVATRTTRTIEHALTDQPRWRWYHGLLFYILAQVLTFSLGAITSVATGQKVKSLPDTSSFAHQRLCADTIYVHLDHPQRYRGHLPTQRYQSSSIAGNADDLAGDCADRGLVPGSLEL